MKLINNKLLLISLSKIAFIMIILSIINITKSTHTSTEFTNTNGIFYSFSKMMSKMENKADLSNKSKLSNRKMNYSPPPITLIDIAGDHLSKDQEEQQDPVITNIKLGNPPYYSGWIKYFKYNSDSGEKKPTTFYKNPDYLPQMMKNPNLDVSIKDDENQYKYIPNETLFYSTLFDTTFNIANSKEVSINLIFYSLHYPRTALFQIMMF